MRILRVWGLLTIGTGSAVGVGCFEPLEAQVQTAIVYVSGARWTALDDVPRSFELEISGAHSGEPVLLSAEGEARPMTYSPVTSRYRSPVLPRGSRWVLELRGARTSERRRIRFSPDAEFITVTTAVGAGAQIDWTWPADGATQVPTTLASIWLCYDDIVLDDLIAATGASTEINLVLDTRVTEDATSCSKWTLASRMPHAIWVTVEARSLSHGTLGRFGFYVGTNDTYDVGLPNEHLNELSGPCQRWERQLTWGCVLNADSQFRIRLQSSVPFLLFEPPSGIPQPALEGAISIWVEHPASPTELVLLDWRGQHTGLTVLPPQPAALPTVTISEVAANVVGSEDHEWVELWNFGDTPQQVQGFELGDDADATFDILGSTWISPGAHILVVGPRFDREQAGIPSGTTILRLDSPIGSGGLSASGEPLFLLDNTGQWLSEVPRLALDEGVCLFRQDASRQPSPDVFGKGLCTPGR